MRLRRLDGGAIVVPRRARDLGVDHIDIAHFHGDETANLMSRGGASPAQRQSGHRQQGRVTADPNEHPRTAANTGPAVCSANQTVPGYAEYKEGTSRVIPVLALRQIGRAHV